MILLIAISLLLFTIFFKYKEGLDRSEWITPGYHNKDRYYNEHKTSGNPEIDAIEFNHRARKPVYIDSNKQPNMYQSLPIKSPSAPVKDMNPKEWFSKNNPLNKNATRSTHYKMLFEKMSKKANSFSVKKTMN